MFGALSVTVSVPVSVPVAAGVKLTEMVHVPPAARVDGLNGHVVPLTPKFVLAVIVEIVSAVLSPLVRVTT